MKMQNVLLSPIRLDVLETLITNSVEKAIKTHISKSNDNKKDVESFLSIQEAAELLNLTVSTLYSKVSRRELKSYKKGKRLYFSSLELLEYIKSGRKKTNAEIEAEADTYLNKNKVAV